MKKKRKKNPSFHVDYYQIRINYFFYDVIDKNNIPINSIYNYFFFNISISYSKVKCCRV